MDKRDKLHKNAENNTKTYINIFLWLKWHKHSNIDAADIISCVSLTGHAEDDGDDGLLPAIILSRARDWLLVVWGDGIKGQAGG